MLQCFLLLALPFTFLEALQIPLSKPEVFDDDLAPDPDLTIPIGYVHPPPSDRSSVEGAQNHWVDGGFGGNGGYGGYGGNGGYGGYGGGRGRNCRDWWGSDYCSSISRGGLCNSRPYSKKCKLTCGLCKNSCRDISSRCELTGSFMCSRHWYSRRCRKSCNLCEIKTTTPAPVTTEEPVTTIEVCKDNFRRCRNANSYRCTRFNFRMGCKLSCGLCEKEKTTPVPTLPATTKEGATSSPSECRDIREDCDMYVDYESGCLDEFVASECRETCGLCEDIITTAVPTNIMQTTNLDITTPPATTPESKETTYFEMESTTVEVTTPSDCFNARDDCDTYVKFNWFCMVPSVAAECRLKCKMCSNMTATPETSTKDKCHKITPKVSTTTTSTTPEPKPTKEPVSTTEKQTTPKPTTPETTPTTTTLSTSTTSTIPEELIPTTATVFTTEEQTTIQPLDCADEDEESCQIWETLGFCYNEEYREVMEETCMKSCGLC